MEKKLPKVFQNSINKVNNNRTVFYSDKDSYEPNKKVDVNQKIIDIFSSTKYVYKATVVIKLKNKTVEKTIIGKNGSNLITIENELIPITEILDINYK